MDGDNKPLVDARQGRALVHPTRRAILELLAREVSLAPSAIARKLGIAAGNVGYHVEVLLACAAVETVPDETGRGDRAVRLPLRSGKAPGDGKVRLDASDSMRDDVSVAQLKSLIEMAAHLRPRHAPGT